MSRTHWFRMYLNGGKLGRRVYYRNRFVVHEDSAQALLYHGKKRFWIRQYLGRLARRGNKFSPAQFATEVQQYHTVNPVHKTYTD